MKRSILIKCAKAACVAHGCNWKASVPEHWIKVAKAVLDAAKSAKSTSQIQAVSSGDAPKLQWSEVKELESALLSNDITREVRIRAAAWLKEFRLRSTSRIQACEVKPK